jgi:hypothetical protein
MPLIPTQLSDIRTNWPVLVVLSSSIHYCQFVLMSDNCVGIKGIFYAPKSGALWQNADIYWWQMMLYLDLPVVTFVVAGHLPLIPTQLSDIRTNWPVLVVLSSSIHYWIKQCRFKLMFNVRLKICSNII